MLERSTHIEHKTKNLILNPNIFYLNDLNESNTF